MPRNVQAKLITTVRGKIRTQNQDTHLHAPISSDRSKTLTVQEMLKTELVDEGPQILSRWCNQSIRTFAGSQQGQWEGQIQVKGLWNSLLQYVENPNTASSHVSVQNNQCTLVSTTRLCSKSSLFSIVYGPHVTQFLFFTPDHFPNTCVVYVSRSANTQNICIWSTEDPREFQHRKRHREK